MIINTLELFPLKTYFLNLSDYNRICMLDKKMYDLFDPILKEFGYEIVRIQIIGNLRKTLQFMIERLDEKPIILDDCVKVSKHLSTHLNVHDPIKENYHLEVSSPGLDRPLIRPKDYKRFLGREIMVRTVMPFGNRRNFCGIITEANEKTFVMKLEEPLDDKSNLELSFDDIQKANLAVKFD